MGEEHKNISQEKMGELIGFAVAEYCARNKDTIGSVNCYKIMQYTAAMISNAEVIIEALTTSPEPDLLVRL